MRGRPGRRHSQSIVSISSLTEVYSGSKPRRSAGPSSTERTSSVGTISPFLLNVVQRNYLLSPQLVEAKLIMLVIDLLFKIKIFRSRPKCIECLPFLKSSGPLIQGSQCTLPVPLETSWKQTSSHKLLDQEVQVKICLKTHTSVQVS